MTLGWNDNLISSAEMQPTTFKHELNVEKSRF